MRCRSFQKQYQVIIGIIKQRTTMSFDFYNKQRKHMWGKKRKHNKNEESIWNPVANKAPRYFNLFIIILPLFFR